MTRARRMVMSQSTFSWWPTFLGTPDEVVCPVPSFGVWSPEGEAKDARYHDWRVLKGRVVLGINHRLGLSLKAPRSSRRPWLSSCSHWSHRFEARAGFDPLTLPWRNCSPVPSW